MLESVAMIHYGTRVTKRRDAGTQFPVYGGGGATFAIDRFNRQDCFIVSRFGMSEECVRYVSGRFFLNDSGLTVTSKDTSHLDQRYLDYFLLSKQPEIYALGRGTAQKNLNVENFKRLGIEIPPLKEQKRIVALLDQAFAALDRARANTEANLSDEENLRGPAASDLLKQERPPAHWTAHTLDDIAVLRGGYAFKSSQYTEDGAFVLRTVNIDNDGSIKRGNDKFIGQETVDEYQRFELQSGDTLFVMVGATLGKTGFVEIADLPALLNQNMWVIRARSRDLEPRFLNFLFRELTREIVANSRGAARSFVKRDDVRKLPLFLPPAAEQREILKQIEQFNDRLFALKYAYINASNDLDDLRQSLLQKAFAGTLA